MPKSNSPPESTPRRSYHFFKIYLPNLSSTHMRIPPAFHRHVEGRAPARFYLKGPSEFIWGVDLVKKPDGLFFSDGWETFALDHALAAGDFLLFEYNGNSTFSVMIFDNTACEKEVAFFARPTCDEKVSFSFDERVKEEKKDNSYVGTNQPVKKRTRTLPGTNNECSEVFMARMWSMQRQAAQALISGRLDHSRDSSNLFNNAIECPSDANLVLSDNRANDASRKKRYRGFVSQRRPVTQKERDDALAKAQSFKSENPCFMMVMKGSYVYNGFYLALPGPFPFKHLPDYNGELFLHDPNKQQWAVRYIFSKRPALSGGWGKFAVGNNLESDDVCVFELIKKKHMKVHIFRVLEDIKPLLRPGRVKDLVANAEANENFKALIDYQ
ncbi:B3 domain-containing protein Os01g0723500 isoform X2 [Dendrobium catenatum]|uniref:B3 domain-containing protein Os01g0723500 isoform X2 n=1 Tax=Dendrobium catenatum TaxID=906689 RepID=UPI0009F165BD|nr:B3 domain-containing protein Os01g0723500 isoform X2 [Dendrobium catenatum]